MNSQSPIVDKMKQIRAMQAAMRGKVIYKEKQGDFIGGGKWEIVTKFQGKSHKEGGIDLEVNDGYVRRISGTDDVDDIAKNGRVWRSVGAGAYGIGEGVLDTITFGATDALTDWGYEGLQKIGGSTSEDEKREQDSIRGYGITAGAIGGAVLTGGGNVGSAIQQGTKGLGMGVSKGSPDSKFAQGVGTYLPLAGSIAGMVVGNSGYSQGSALNELVKYGKVGGRAFNLAKASGITNMAGSKKAEETKSPSESRAIPAMMNMYTQGMGMMGGMTPGFGGLSGIGGAVSGARNMVSGGSGVVSASPTSTEEDMFYAQVPMREDTLAQLTRYNINV